MSGRVRLERPGLGPYVRAQPFEPAIEEELDGNDHSWLPTKLMAVRLNESSRATGLQLAW